MKDYNVYEEISKTLEGMNVPMGNDQVDFLLDHFCPTEEAKLALLSDLNAMQYEMMAECKDVMDSCEALKEVDNSEEYEEFNSGIPGSRTVPPRRGVFLI